MNNIISLRLAAALALAVLLGACTHAAPVYTASVASVDVTSKLQGAIAVGKFTFAPGQEAQLNSVGARADTFTSPVNNSFADYIGDAATKDLKAAGKFDPASPRVLTGVLEKNYLSAAGMAVNDSDLIVRFRLAEGGQVLYEQPVEAKREWESSLLGAIAIPRALDNYIVTIQELMRKLFADPQFVAATAGKK